VIHFFSKLVKLSLFMKRPVLPLCASRKHSTYNNTTSRHHHHHHHHCSACATARERTDLATDSGSGPISVNRIGSGPVKIGHRSGANSPFRRIVCFIAPPQHKSHRWNKAVISLCRRLLCNHCARPRPFRTCSGQRVGVFQREVLQ